jgi:hypothetical protein
MGRKVRQVKTARLNFSDKLGHCHPEQPIACCFSRRYKGTEVNLP